MNQNANRNFNETVADLKSLTCVLGNGHAETDTFSGASRQLFDVVLGLSP